MRVRNLDEACKEAEEQTLETGSAFGEVDTDPQKTNCSHEREKNTCSGKQDVFSRHVCETSIVEIIQLKVAQVQAPRSGDAKKHPTCQHAKHGDGDNRRDVDWSI